MSTTFCSDGPKGWDIEIQAAEKKLTNLRKFSREIERALETFKRCKAQGVERIPDLPRRGRGTAAQRGTEPPMI